jgi:hypothetical protein
VLREPRQGNRRAAAKGQRGGEHRDEVFVAHVLDVQAPLRDRLGDECTRKFSFGDVLREAL